MHTYQGCCHDHDDGIQEAIALAATTPQGFGGLMEKIIRDIWKQKATEAGFSPELVRAYGEQLGKAVTKGYGKDFFAMDFTAPDYERIKRLHIDAWKFASGKGNRQMQELSGALVKPDGTMRTFEEFRQETVNITGRQLSGLRAEYNTAVSSAQMAAKWEAIQRQKGIYPYLQFVAVEDPHTTALCRGLNGVVRAVDDPFWAQYYPPNHYNCRSTVKQLRKAPEREQSYTEPNFPEAFRTNMAAADRLFPEGHSYYQGVDPNELFNRMRPYLPYDLQFDRIELPQEASGYLQRHFMADAGASDYQRLMLIATEKATKGAKVDILPTLHPNKYAAQRQIIFPDAKPGRSPDLRINQLLWEEEYSTRSFNINNIKHAIGAGAKQADRVTITLSEAVDRQLLDRMVNGRWTDHKELLEIVFRFNGEEWVYKRP